MTTIHSPQDGRIFAKECRTLAAAGYEVHLIASNAKSGVRDGVRIWGVSAPRSGRRLTRMSWTASQVYRPARALPADLYQIHDPELVPAGLLLGRSGAPVVYDAHEDLAATVLDKHWIRKPLRPCNRPTRRQYRARGWETDSAAVVAATPAIEERFSACDCEVVTVNNFPELHEFQKVHRPDIGGEPVVCYVGGISASRGIDVMVDASAMTDARLVLGGSFDLPDLVDRIRALPR